jgi:hypothetical protein
VDDKQENKILKGEIMVLTASQETVLIKWIEWQKQASITNTISKQMEDRQNALRVELARPLTYNDMQADTQFQALKTQHDTEALKCDKPFNDFKTMVKEVIL